MNTKKSLISLFLICVYSIMIVHNMAHIHTHNSDFDTIATSYECVQKQIETNSSCNCGCHPSTNAEPTIIGIKVACQSTTCMQTHKDDHQHHECNIVTIYDNIVRNSDQKQFISDIQSSDTPYALFSTHHDEQLNESTIITTLYLLRQVPLPKSAYALGAKSLRAPPVVLFS